MTPTNTPRVTELAKALVTEMAGATVRTLEWHWTDGGLGRDALFCFDYRYRDGELEIAEDTASVVWIVEKYHVDGELYRFVKSGSLLSAAESAWLRDLWLTRILPACRADIERACIRDHQSQYAGV